MEIWIWRSEWSCLLMILCVIDVCDHHLWFVWLFFEAVLAVWTELKETPPTEQKKTKRIEEQQVITFCWQHGLLASHFSLQIWVRILLNCTELLFDENVDNNQNNSKWCWPHTSTKPQKSHFWVFKQPKIADSAYCQKIDSSTKRIIHSWHSKISKKLNCDEKKLQTKKKYFRNKHAWFWKNVQFQKKFLSNIDRSIICTNWKILGPKMSWTLFENLLMRYSLRSSRIRERDG